MKQWIVILVLMLLGAFQSVNLLVGEEAATVTEIPREKSVSGAFTERNIYLGALVEWNPGMAGACRAGSWVPENLVPEANDNALGGPTGTGSWQSGGGSTYIGINGSAAWKFEEGFYVFNGSGDDFRTFQSNFAWGGGINGLCCELGHVEVSEDMGTWYYNSAEEFDVNPFFTQDNSDYRYYHIKGLHGNNPTWANVNQDMDAQEIVDGKWTDNGETVSKDFKPTDPYLGGNGFDLSTFRSKADNSPWPDHGKMRYLRIVDDDTILDGQDYAKCWCLGAHLHAAMAINVKEED